MLLPILGLVALAGIAGFFVWERHDMAKAYIEADLKHARAALVRIEADWMDMDRDTFSYDVVYDDSQGKRIHNRAKVAVRPGRNGTVYWHSPLS